MLDNYINKIDKNKINNFALKNNINLNDQELDILLFIVKNKKDDLLQGNEEESLKLIKENLSKKNSNKVLKLYYYYKDLFRGYLI